MGLRSPYPIHKDITFVDGSTERYAGDNEWDIRAYARLDRKKRGLPTQVRKITEITPS